MRYAKWDILFFFLFDCFFGSGHNILAENPVKLFFLAHHAAPGPFAGARIGMRSLAMHRKAAAMPQPAVTTYIHKPFYISGNLAAQIALNLVVLLKFLANFVDFVSRKVIDVPFPVYACCIKYLQCRGTAYAINISEGNINPLSTRQINASYSRHNISPNPGAAYAGGFHK